MQGETWLRVVFLQGLIVDMRTDKGLMRGRQANISHAEG